LAIAVALSFSAATAQTPEAGSQIEQVVRRILELQGEIDGLLESLDPRVRAEVESRLEQGPIALAAEPVDPPRPAVSAPSVAPVTTVAAGTGCRPLAPLDSDGDGQVSGADRYWRHLYLWDDANANGQVDAGEAVSLFELDIRSVSVELDRYTTDKDFVGDVSAGAEAVFHLIARRKGPSRRSLALDADGLRRGEGPSLVDAADAERTGIQPLRRGDALIDSAGDRSRFPCA
jgi:hypothetical protein